MRISVQKAHQIMHSEDVAIVDVRDADAFTQGHISKAQRVSSENVKTFLQETNKDLPLICYCYHGVSSQQAAEYFFNQGFKQVYSIDGGWEEWEEVYG